MTSSCCASAVSGATAKNEEPRATATYKPRCFSIPLLLHRRIERQVLAALARAIQIVSRQSWERQPVCVYLSSHFGRQRQRSAGAFRVLFIPELEKQMQQTSTNSL